MISVNRVLGSRSNLGVATVALIVILIIIVAAAGTASYFVIKGYSGSPPSSQSISTTSHSTSSGSGSQQTNILSTTSSSLGSASTSSSSTSSGSNSFNPSYYVTSWKDLLGNFSQMTVEYNESGQANSTFSYDVVGHPIINSSQFTEVNFTVTSTNNPSPSSVILWYDSNGNATMITQNGYNYTSSTYGNIDALYASAFQIGFLNPTNLNVLAQSTNMGSSAQTLGSTQLNVVSYNWNVPYSSGETWSIHIGNVPGTSLYVLTYYVISSGGNEQLGFEVLSLSRA
jgi:hypothetical protein